MGRRNNENINYTIELTNSNELPMDYSFKSSVNFILQIIFFFLLFRDDCTLILQLFRIHEYSSRYRD